MLYKIMLVSAMQQHESVINIYIPSILSLPPITPSHPSRSSQSPRLSSLCYTSASHWLSILHMVMYMCQCYSLNSSYPLLSHCVKSILYIDNTYRSKCKLSHKQNPFRRVSQYNYLLKARHLDYMIL